jgi:TRAP-type transport system small permease protein
MSRFIVAVLQAASVVLISALVLVTVADVIGRYALNAPLPGAFELTQVLLGALVFAALPLTTLRGEHVEVDLMAHVLPQRVQTALGIFAGFVSGIVLLAFAGRLWIVAAEQMAVGSRTASLGIPTVLIAVLGVASCAASAAIAVLKARR